MPIPISIPNMHTPPTTTHKIPSFALCLQARLCDRYAKEEDGGGNWHWLIYD
ncbi:hypothetical protein ACO22_07637 [Paracoccidioides brasiliensis]|uniref:Uncharacterized protein n=1 Tax=Paracoccidioides brasiliensis TaxID=121759 RepID=A0A1D2J4I5_PARBR|nr:hypothetical protein ACO22_07637 [Paracoccidioides brasiliensis]